MPLPTSEEENTMTRTRRIDWLAYWTDNGFDAQMINGKLHCKHEEYETSEEQWTDCDAWWNGLSEAQLADNKFPDLYEDYVGHRYCGTCKNFISISDAIYDPDGEHHVQCIDCEVDRLDDAYERMIDSTHYPL